MKKVGLLMILIFSFLLSVIIPNNRVKAKEDGENYQTYVELTITSRNGNIVSFSVKDSYNVMAITYEYTFYINETLVSKLVQREEKFKKIDSKTYSIDLSAIKETVEGVKIQKIKHTLDDKSWVDKRTTGNNYVGNMESKYKYNYVELSDTKLVTKYINTTVAGSWSFSNYENRVYFKFADLVPEDITKLTVEYDQYTNEWTNYLLWKTSSNSAKVNHSYEVTKEDYVKQYGDHATIFDDVFGKFEKVYSIQKSDNNNFDWSVALPQTNIRTNDSGLKKYTEVIENACIIKMSYLTEGKYYEDIPVLSEDTGWVHYEEYSKPASFIEKIKKALNWISDHVWIIVAILAFIAFLIAIIICKSITTVIVGIYKIIKGIFKAVWFVIKVIFNIIALPFRIIILLIKKIKGKAEE